MTNAWNALEVVAQSLEHRRASNFGELNRENVDLGFHSGDGSVKAGVSPNPPFREGRGDRPGNLLFEKAAGSTVSTHPHITTPLERAGREQEVREKGGINVSRAKLRSTGLRAFRRDTKQKN